VCLVTGVELEVGEAFSFYFGFGLSLSVPTVAHMMYLTRLAYFLLAVV